MTILRRPVKGLGDPNQQTRDRETLNNVLNHQFDDWRRPTASEKLAGVTVINAAYPPGDVRRYGAVGDDSTDCTAAIAAAILVAGTAGGGPVFIPAGIFRVTVVGEIPYGVHLIGIGPGASIIKKCTASAVFTIKTFYTGFENIGFDADVATDTTYGTSGPMVDYPSGFSSANSHFVNVNSVNVDTVCRFAGDAGVNHQVIGGIWNPYSNSAGSEGNTYQTGNGGTADSGACFRIINALTTNGQIDLTGSTDTNLAAVNCRRVITASNTNLLSVMGGIWGSLGVAVTISGQNTRIMGVRVSGNITLANTMSGSCCFIGNIQTAGTFTDSSPAQVCEVIHHPLGAGYMNLNKQTITQSNNAEEVQTRRIGANSGDADTTLTLDQSQTVVMYNTALTAARAVTLPATARNGFTIRVVRQSGATGAFNLNVGSGPLKALTAASQWCEVQWSGPASAWVLTASGTL